MVKGVRKIPFVRVCCLPVDFFHYMCVAGLVSTRMVLAEDEKGISTEQRLKGRYGGLIRMVRVFVCRR